MNLTLTADRARSKALQAIHQLPPFNPVLNKLLASLNRDDVMLDELAGWIEKDAVMAASVLRIVNSAAYGRLGTIGSVRHAISILGTNKVRNIVMGVSVNAALNKLKLPKAWSGSRFNAHGIAVATMADLLAQNMEMDYAEGAFVAGLLHDIGKLLFAVALPEEYQLALTESHEQERSIIECELDHLGITHPELSMEALFYWKLPAPVCFAVRHHHNPDADTSTVGLMALSRGIQLADFVAHEVGITLEERKEPPRDPTGVLAAYGLDRKADRIVAEFNKELEVMKNMM